MNKPIPTMHPAADEINSEDVDMVLCNKRRYTFYSDDEKIKLFHLVFSKCNPSAILTEAVEHLLKSLVGLNVSRSTVYNLMTTQCNVSIKQAQFQPVERNSEEKMQQRCDWIQKWQQTDLDFTTNCAFLDESAFHIKLRRGMAWLKKGTSAIVTMSTTKANATLILDAISATGLTNVSLRVPKHIKKRKLVCKTDSDSVGTVTGQYLNFLKAALNEMDSYPEMKEYYLVMNNAPIHISTDIGNPTLDIAHCGFRVARSTLDQELSLVEICSILRKHHKVTLTLALLDIKSVYDTVDRCHVWQILEQSLDPALFNLLKNLFNDVQIEVLLGNAKSSRFSPATGVLQTSPPYLTTFLQKCEDHSYQLGFRWNPLKCAILFSSSDTQDYALYGITLPRQVSFSYLGIPISPGGYLNTKKLIQNNINKAQKTMNQMTVIGVNSTGFDKLTSTRFYSQIVRPQFEYGLIISAVKFKEPQKIESCQNQCLRRIFGGTSRSSIKVMLHLVNQPTMKERTHILQAKFLLRTIDTPDDTLMFRLLPYIRTSTSHSQWYKLTTSPLWRLCAETDPDQLDQRKFKAIRQDYLQESFENCRTDTNSILLSACRPQLVVDPILWLPMSYIERSRLIRWRMGWLPGGRPKPCIYHPHDLLTRSHAITCLHMYHRLLMPSTVSDPLSYLLNLLPTSRKKSTIQSRSKYSAWFIRWPIICQILHELDYLHHDKTAPEIPPLGTKLLHWFSPN
ncbi:hypothetical protein G6F37_001390 [Rhizopus arrhizus]|nr:hypothetical protein G6F38_000721 [Rhizopus arrhizus]KAG1163253.1 hypothetical protein G6F37_001390 [Rhizopus arrhizus]